MKILLDECVTKRIRPYLQKHEVFTVTEKGWNGLFNGKLMTKCVEDGIDILLTIDKNILFQQNISKYNLCVVIFDSIDSKVSSLITFLPSFEHMLGSIEKGRLYLIEPPEKQ